MLDIDSIDFYQKRILMRVDFNVPLNKKLEVTDNTRIVEALPTISKILKEKGSVILMSHLGRPQGKEDKYSLRHIVQELNVLLKKNVIFLNDCIGDEVEKTCNNLLPETIVLLENLRFYKEETNGDIEFARKLSKLGDIYLNDAFGTIHRKHASTSIIADFFPKKRLFGYLINKELKNINKILKSPVTPVIAIIGGAKISSKVSIIKELLNSVNHILIGGAMTYTFLKSKGFDVGDSLVEDDYLELAKDILLEAEKKKVNIELPIDHVISNGFSNTATSKIVDNKNIGKGWMGLDIGPKTIKIYKELLLQSKTILWNGPMGVFELPLFENGTKQLALAVAESTKNKAFSLIGGGDSVAAVNKYNLKNEVSYISTGGGALLEYIEGKDLPGIVAIKNEN